MEYDFAFDIIGLCLEGFLFGEISVLRLSLPFPTKARVEIVPPCQDCILDICSSFAIHALSNDNRKQNILFHALYVLYVLSAAVVALDIAIWVASVFLSDTSFLYI